MCVKDGVDKREARNEMRYTRCDRRAERNEMRTVGRSIDEGGRNVKRLQLDREVMIQVDNSAAEAEVTGRQPDVDAIRQEIEPVAEASGRSMRRSCNGQGSSQSPGTIT